jgi:hypothetical protein
MISENVSRQDAKSILFLCGFAALREHILTLAKVLHKLVGKISAESRIERIDKRTYNLRKGSAPPG